jgi:hypothetical protein
VTHAAAVLCAAGSSTVSDALDAACPGDVVVVTVFRGRLAAASGEPGGAARPGVVW